MKKYFLAVCAAVAFALPVLTSCGDDFVIDGRTPSGQDSLRADSTNHDHDHDHEEESVTRIVLTLSSGHFHGVKFHGDGINSTLYLDNDSTEDVEPRFYKSVQTITLEKEDGTWQVAEGSDSVFRVLSAGNYSTPYGLWINYYAADGEMLNEEFAGSEATINGHQHFFTAANIRSTFDGDATARYKADSLFTYVYMDTNPWNATLKDAGTQLIGSNFISEGNFTPKNPVGLKGYFTFLQPRTRFDIRVRLKHFEGGSKFVDGVPYAFNKPAASAHDELSYSVPVIVFASRNETDRFRTTIDIDWDTRTVTNYDSFTAAEKRYVESLRAAYGCTLQEILWDFYLKYDNGLNAESGTLWF